MNPIPAIESTSSDRQHTLQAAIQSRYAWLLRWALHFTDNDRDAAEDLVQETVVRLLLAWDSLRNHEDLEPLLYSYLRYTHLSEQRRMQKQAFQRFSITDFDTLAISLRTSSRPDQIEVQNEIRTILDFLLWRRHSARLANFFLLRFFHGYFPEEIAAICISKRFAVDIGLNQTRRELKTHLAKPHQLRVLGRNQFVDETPHNTLVPVDKFEDDLRIKLFHSAHDACPSLEVFDRVYNSLNNQPVETSMIAHIVCCEQCLKQASHRCGVPPPSNRSIDESLSRAPHGGPKRAAPSQKQRLERIFAAGESRLREIYEHHPAELMIALNAEVAAVRDVPQFVRRATLKVETHAIDKLEMIEVLCENGIPLLSIPIFDRPPKSQPEILHVIGLSDDRTLSLMVRFTHHGAFIEATYEDPHGSEAMESAHQLAAAEELELFRESEYHDDSTCPKQTVRWRGLLHGIYRRVMTAQILVPVAAVLAGLALFITLTFEERQRERIDVNQLLRAAVRAEATPGAASPSSVIIQQIQIKAAGHTVQRSLYRDTAGRRQPNELRLNEDEQLLREKLAEAKLDWSDPLSAESFRDWHDHLYREEDSIATTGGNLLTVSTTAAEGTIAEEKLTVRADSFHTIARSIRFRNGQTIEIAELNYDTVPWSSQLEQRFEPLATASPIARVSAPSLPLPAILPLSTEQLDVAELGTRLALQQLHADTERLDVVRTNNGITVKGIVESDERKLEISARLHTIPNVFTSIASYNDLKTKPTGQAISRVNEVSVSESDAPIKHQCEQKHITTDACRNISYTLLSAATVILRESKHLHELRVGFPNGKLLTETAEVLLAAIVRERLHHMDAALDDEQHMLQLISDEPQETESQTDRITFLEDAAQHNLAIAQELLYNNDEHPRPVTIILHELTDSFHTARAATSHETADFQARLDTTSNNTVHKH